MRPLQLTLPAPAGAASALRPQAVADELPPEAGNALQDSSGGLRWRNCSNSKRSYMIFRPAQMTSGQAR